MDYKEQALEPVVLPAFLGLLRFNESSEGLYIEDQAPVHGGEAGIGEGEKKFGYPFAF